MKLKNGVTMLVLVITIVVLLILAGVTLSFVIGENGLLSQTKGASLKSKEDVALEDVGEAWSSLDSDYWEALTNNALVSRGDYFNEESLNRLLKGKGKVTNLKYNENGESGFDYTTDSGNKTYNMVVDENGDIRLGKANLSTGDGDNNNDGNEDKNSESTESNYIYARLLNAGDENYELQLSGDKDFSNSYSNLDIVQDFGSIGNNGYKLSKLSSLSQTDNNSVFKDFRRC